MDLASYFKTYGIALTGGVATGKSFVASYLKKKGFSVFDADQHSRELMRAGTSTSAAVVDCFGTDILSPNGEINRQVLASIIFQDPAARKMLEGIVHPALRDHLNSKISSLVSRGENNYWFYEASLIFESGRAEQFRAVWVTWCDDNLQIKRLIDRDGIDLQKAHMIKNSQWPSEEKKKRATRVIDTSETKHKTAARVEGLLQELEDRP